MSLLCKLHAIGAGAPGARLAGAVEIDTCSRMEQVYRDVTGEDGAAGAVFELI